MSLLDEELWFRKDVFERPGSQRLLAPQMKPAIFILEGDDTRRQGLKEALLRRGFAVVESSDNTGIVQNLPNLAIRLTIYRR